MANTINFLSLTGLQTYDLNIKSFIAEKLAEGDAPAFKYVNLVDGVLKFYTVNPITEDTQSAFEIELPEQDLSHLMELVEDAVNGNVAVFGDNGQVVDGGVALADLATKDEVETAKGEVQASVDELAELIGELPEGTTAKDVIDYVNIKTSGIATDAALEELNNQVSGLQTAVQGIQADYLKAEDKEELAGQIAAVDAKADANADAIAAIEKDFLKAADKEELEGKIKANADAIDVLNGEGEGSVKKAIDEAINKFATDVTNDEVVNSYKELIDWAAEHGADAAEMAAGIAANKTAVEALASLVGELPEGETSEDLVAFIQKLVNAEVAAREAKDAEIEGAIEALGTQVAKDIQAAKEAAIADAAADATEKANKALEDAKAYADEKIGDVDLSGIAANAEAIEAEKAAREAADALKADKTELAAEVTAREEAIAGEASAREEAIGAEKTAREEAIAALAETHNADKEALAGDIAGVVADVEALEKLHGEDKAELAGDIAELAQAHADFEASLQEISVDQINALFPAE